MKILLSRDDLMGDVLPPYGCPGKSDKNKCYYFVEKQECSSCPYNK